MAKQDYNSNIKRSILFVQYFSISVDSLSLPLALPLTRTTTDFPNSNMVFQYRLPPLELLLSVPRNQILNKS